MPLIKWKVPKIALQQAEQRVLLYLGENTDDKLKRTNLAIASGCFPRLGLSSVSRTSKTLRTLMALGVVECVREFGTTYYNRLKEDGTAAAPDDTWVDRSGDTGVFKVPGTCSIFQATAVRHPEPVDLEHLAENALYGEPLPEALRVVNFLRAAGFVDVRYGQAKRGSKEYSPTKVWLSKRGEEYWQEMCGRPSDTRVVLEYLRKYRDKPGMCRLQSIGCEAFGMDADAMHHIKHRVAPILRDLVQRGEISRRMHQVEKWYWYFAH